MALIFVDTNVFYNITFDNKFTDCALNFLETRRALVTSATVIHELIYVSVRDLCEKLYGTRNYSSFRKFIATKGYAPFQKEIDFIYALLEDSNIELVPIDQDLDRWREIMQSYSLLSSDALIALTCRSNGIKRIATFDNDFKRVDFLEMVELYK
jgi:predicted nucleic acid-binding protein